MKEPALRIDHVGIAVRELDEAIAFFERALELRVIRRRRQPRQAFVGRDAVVLGLVESPAATGRGTVAHIAFPCAKSAFPRIVRRLWEQRIPILSGPRQQRGGLTILFQDPSGNIFEICYPSLLKPRQVQDEAGLAIDESVLAPDPQPDEMAAPAAPVL